MVHTFTEQARSVSRWSSETRYKILLELNNAIVTCKSREDLFSALSKELQRHFAYDRLCIMLYDAKLHTITYFAAADGIQPTGGRMGVLEAMNAAISSLKMGRNPNKKIVLITDGQSAGWRTGSEAQWQFVAESLADLPRPPKVICRRLPLPGSVRNVAVAGIRFSRRVIGTERPVGIKLLDARRHFHVIGPTGVGKSTMLLRMIWQYLDRFPDTAVWLQEPHQDLTHKAC